MNLRTQDAQAACFENAARHLRSGGLFVAEIMLPELQRLAPGESFVPFEASAMHLGFDEYDIAEQGLTSHHCYPAEGPTQRSPAATFGCA
jgi:hypothetical protein